MRKGTIFIVLVLLLSVCASPVYAADIPPLPHAFYGDVTINDSPAPVETTVEARGPGVATGVGNPITTTERGKYGSADPLGVKLIVQGDIPPKATITFYVNDVSTGQTYLFKSGETTELPLTVTIPATIDYSPSSFSFTATAGGANPSSQTLSISNSGVNPTAMAWSVTSNAAWLSLSPASGSSSGEVDSVTLSVSISGMTAGSYTATITISAPGATNTPQTVPVSLAIAAALAPGGGGAGERDTTPPTISDISVSNITKTSADISWKTDEMSDSQAEYWTSPSKLSPLDTAMVINHLVHLTGLTPGTTYHYKTMSKDLAGNLAVSDEHTFTTLPGAAAFAASKLSISPGEVYVSETVTISAVITNTGDGAGSYKVTLKINGVVEATKDVTLNPGASGEVTFTAVKNVAGSYSVEVDGLKGSFTVKEKLAPTPTPPVTVPPPVTPVKPPIKWPLIGCIIAGVVVVGLLIFFLARRRA